MGEKSNEEKNYNFDRPFLSPQKFVFFSIQSSSVWYWKLCTAFASYMISYCYPARVYANRSQLEWKTKRWHEQKNQSEGWRRNNSMYINYRSFFSLSLSIRKRWQHIRSTRWFYDYRPINGISNFHYQISMFYSSREKWSDLNWNQSHHVVQRTNFALWTWLRICWQIYVCYQSKYI